MKLHIAEVDGFSSNALELLSNHYSVSFGHVGNEQLRQKLRTIDIFWFRLGYRINNHIIDENTRCKYLVSPVTGIDHIDEKLCINLGIKIVCLRGERFFLRTVRATAEHTVLLTLALMRNVVGAVLDVRNGLWRRDRFKGFELFRKKVGIIGYGRLGRIVGSYFHHMGCEVGFYDIRNLKGTNQITRFTSMEECISESDIISLHIPYNNSNHHLIDRKQFKHFDDQKWLINTSRGGVIDEGELLKLLKNQKIAGAAIDVIDGEPNIENHDLIEYANRNNNLIITPHIGGCTIESWEKTELFIANKLIKTTSYQETI